MQVVAMTMMATLLVYRGSAPSAEGSKEEIQHFLARDWGFECVQSDGCRVVRSVWGCQLFGARERTFLASLTALEELSGEVSGSPADDIRSVVHNCPSLRGLHIRPSDGEAGFEAAVWPELFRFQNLKRLSVERLHCSGNEEWAIGNARELDSLTVSGNLSGMLPALLAPCKMRSLRIEFLASRQYLTAADYAALNSHAEMESLEILGDIFGGGMQVDLNALSGLGRLRHLSLRQCTVDPVHLHSFRALRVLSLQTCRFIDHGFGTVLTHPALEQLVLSQCNIIDLRVAGPYVGPPRRLRAITLRFPVVDEIKAFHGLRCSYDVELGLAGLCVPTAKAHTLRWIGPHEAALLQQLNQLRSVSVVGGLPRQVWVDTAALVQLSRIETLRKLELREVELAHDAPPARPGGGSAVEEARFLTYAPLSSRFLAELLGAKTRVVFLGDQSGSRSTYCQWMGGTHCKPKEVGFAGIALPTFQSSLECQLLTGSVEELVLESCRLNKGAIQQLVARVPSLKRLALRWCLFADERELLCLNEFPDLKRVDFSGTAVSSNTALATSAEWIRFGGTWRCAPNGKDRL